MKKITASQIKNSKAKELNEYEVFVSFKGKDRFSCTDLIFDTKGELKKLKSELSKEEVKEIFSQLVDEYYSKYY